jgi:hypothetical protein
LFALNEEEENQKNLSPSPCIFPSVGLTVEAGGQYTHAIHYILLGASIERLQYHLDMA